MPSVERVLHNLVLLWAQSKPLRGRAETFTWFCLLQGPRDEERGAHGRAATPSSSDDIQDKHRSLHARYAGLQHPTQSGNLTTLLQVRNESAPASEKCLACCYLMY
eukprot:5665554-Amphidinium_carterae.1